MKATAPPLPESLGLLIMLKLGGVRELRVEGRDLECFRGARFRKGRGFQCPDQE